MKKNKMRTGRTKRKRRTNPDSPHVGRWVDIDGIQAHFTGSQRLNPKQRDALADIVRAAWNRLGAGNAET